MKNETKNKHLTLEDRIEIQECLSHGLTFKAIARRVGKDPTTVSREVLKRAEVYKKRFTKTEEPCPKLMQAPD